MSGDDELECPVCLDIMTDPVILSCAGQHRVCKSHIEELATRQGSTCPLCRTVVSDLRSCPVDRFMKKLCDEKRRAPSSSVAPPQPAQSSQSDDLSSIYVVNMTGKRVPYEVNGCTKVAELKRMIQDRDGLSPDQYRLIWAGRVMEDAKKLADYKLQNLQAVQLVMRYKGGMMADDDDDELTCVVCMDTFTDPVMLSCAGQHRVCQSHIPELVGQGSKCPYCKTAVDMKNCKVDRFMKNLCDKKRQAPSSSVTPPQPSQSSQSNGLSSIYVVNMTGKRVPYEVNGCTKVVELKRMIQDKDGLSPDQYRLIWAGRVMEDAKKLADYKLQNLQAVQLVMRYKGGMASDDDELTCAVCMDTFTYPVMLIREGQYRVCKSHLYELWLM